jgi:predicted permease
MESAASHNCVPFASDCTLVPLTQLDGRPVERDAFPSIEVHVISRDYLRAMRIPLRAGRSFDSREAPGDRTAVMVNETAARLLWRDQPAVGRRVASGGPDAAPMEVIGVVADVKYDAIDAPARPAFYFASNQGFARGGSVIVARTRGGQPAQALPAIRRIIAETDPTIAVFGVTTGPELVGRAASSTRFVTLLLTLFGVGAALLAALGVYGVLAYLVTQRQREFGVRMAIGAPPSSVLALVVRQGAALTAVGLALGVAGALAATKLLSSFLYGVARGDVATYAVIIVLVGVAGVLAALLPARRATRVDPVIALRE